MNEYLAKKLKLDKEKVPQSISKYGNTSSVTIPLTIVDQLKGNIINKNMLLAIETTFRILHPCSRARTHQGRFTAPGRAVELQDHTT